MRIRPWKFIRFLLILAVLLLVVFLLLPRRRPASAAAVPSLPSPVPAGSPAPSAPASSARPVPWNLILVNRDHPVDPQAVSRIRTVALRNGQSVDERCYPDLQRMMDDCRQAGYSPVICSSFRTRQKQEELFAEQVALYRRQGMTEEEARAKTRQSIAVPGTSEHELGLAVDITDINCQQILSGMESQPVQQWLAANCWKYGFILRYPRDKAAVTGIVYEPWHYRFVGKEAAAYITGQGITLEEYLHRLFGAPY